MSTKEIIMTKSLREQVYEYLRRKLNTGELKPGAFLNLNEMSAKLGISKTPLREALIQLELEGFVVFYPRRGIMVNPLTKKDIRHAYEIIGALEAAVILSNFDKLRSDENIRKLEEENKLMREALDRDDFDTFYEHNIAFHNVYLNLSDNETLIKTVMTLKSRLYDFPRRKGFVKEWELRSTGEHETFVGLIKDGDARGASEFIRDVHWSFKVQERFINIYYAEAEAAEKSAR
ncbi:MAG: GntR family transcriptional regulator [Thermovirga sp.]|nr:GntR family transcriptional regulator [Thermovirga sp.]